MAIHPEKRWHYVPLRFRGKTLALLAHVEPLMPLNDDQRAIVKTLSCLAASYIHAENVDRQLLREQGKLEREQEKLKRLLAHKQG